MRPTLSSRPRAVYKHYEEAGGTPTNRPRLLGFRSAEDVDEICPVHRESHVTV